MTSDHLHGTVDDIRDQLRQRGWSHAEKLHIPAPESIPANAFETDKVIQGYMPVYEQIRDELGTAARICEVGVWWGGSLGTWQAMFPDGIIAGVDIDECSYWPPGTIKIVMLQEDPELPRKLAGISSTWDLIVDDASHQGWRTAVTFNNLWPLVRPGGYYVIEDWFYGWHAGQFGEEYTMVDLAKGMLDFLRGGYDIEEIRYRYGMVILRKVRPNQNLPHILVELDKMADSPLRVDYQRRLTRPELNRELGKMHDDSVRPGEPASRNGSVPGT